MISMTIPLQLVNGANTREHWGSRARRAKAQRDTAAVFIRAALRDKRATGHDIPPPYSVTLTRIGKRKMDSDNLAISAKAVRDGVADALGVDDGDEAKVTWAYRQDIRDYYAVKIEILSQAEERARFMAGT